MLRTRLWMGAVLILLGVAMLVIDQSPYFPFLLLLMLVLCLAGCFEFLHLLPPERRPSSWLCYFGILGLVLANWPANIWADSLDASFRDPWLWISAVLAATVLGALLVAMAHYQEKDEPGKSANQIGLTLLIILYLGFLPCFLAQLRWLPAGVGAMALTIFVPKCCDSGAYFTGRLLGRHKMTPVLSPKKTWEGFAGGMAAAALGAWAINASVLNSPLSSTLAAIGFGLSVGVAGVLGDLAESLIKRDSRRKDASQVMPGFGGVLDVIDSIVFAAPVAYCWFVW
jgi:phosphatidate cytidylyltransferase